MNTLKREQLEGMSPDEKKAASEFALRELDHVRTANEKLDDKTYRLITAVLTYTGLVLTASAIIFNQIPEVFTPNKILLVFSGIISICTLITLIIVIIFLFKVVSPMAGSRTNLKEYINAVQKKRGVFFQNMYCAESAMKTAVESNQEKSDLMKKSKILLVIFLIGSLFAIILLVFTVFL